FDQKLNENRTALCTDRFADSNFSSSLRNGHKHDIHDADPADEQRKSGDEKADRGDSSGNAVEHIDELILLVDSEIIRVIRSEPANPAHHSSYFFFGFLELAWVERLDLNLIIGIAPKGGGELFQRNDGLVIKAAAIEKAAEFV